MGRANTVLMGMLGLVLMSASAMAQDNPAPRNPQDFRQMMMNRIKERLGVTDEEWKGLQPKIEAVTTAQRNTRAGGMFGGRGGRGGAGGDTQPETPVAKAAADLQKTLDNKEAKADEIAAKLTAFREAREKAKADLVKAQKELKELLTQRQEAVMVMMGMLE